MTALGALVLALSESASYAETQCYDISGPAADTKYHVGDTVNAKHSVTTLRQFYVNNNQPFHQAGRVAEVVSSNILVGGTPSLKPYSINAQVTPTLPVQNVWFAIRRKHGGAYIENFKVNGQKRVLQGWLSQLH
ncbi:MAG: hypothetical protein AB7P17_12210 [Nitrospirales bacterium]|nr:hypothetical protein [Nitrospirales bacterium]